MGTHGGDGFVALAESLESVIRYDARCDTDMI